ncbi:MAG TPA: ATP-binding protein [Clostridia bacterium]|nr:ATP-binding protein [Clostridia bacterium]
MKSLNVYSNLVSSNISSISIVTDGLLNSLQDTCGQLNDTTLFDIRVIINELLVNAIMHGNRGNENKSVRISAGIAEKTELYIMIEDEGCGYDYVKLCDEQASQPCDTGPDNMCECGRGLRIVKSLCDKVKVNSKGNKIVIMKHID